MKKLIVNDSLSDKRTWHSYAPIYERLFAPIQVHARNVLEIGVDGGGSTLMFRDYFENAKVLAFDISPIPPALVGQPRIEHHQINAYSEDAISAALANAKGYDLATDDGSHFIEDQTWFVANYAPLLSDAGLLVVEDIQDIANIDVLAKALPAGFEHCCIDLRTVKGRYDDLLFVAWRR